MTCELVELDVALARRYLPLTIDPETDVSDDFKGLADRMAVPHHAGPAFHALLRAGADALSAVRQGLRHESAEVRRRCCLFLDHFVTCDSSPAVRKKAGWLLPGGTIYRKTAPKARKQTRGKVAAA